MGRVAELLNREPQNSWFSAEVDRSTGKPVVNVRVNEHFLKSNNHKMELYWSEFTYWKRVQTFPGDKVPDYVPKKITEYSNLIEMSCGCSGEAIYKKLQYLQQNDGVDKFGRVIAGAKT